MQKLLYTASEVAQLLSLSKAKVYLMAAQGELESVHFGKSVRIPAAALSKICGGSDDR